jgi:hypothetical protein
MHRHVVGDEVEDEAQVGAGERFDQPAEGRLAPELGIELIEIDDVVAVQAAGARLEKGRRVNVADSQRLR